MSGVTGILWRVALLAVLTLAGFAAYSWSTGGTQDEKIVAIVQDSTDQSGPGAPDPKQGMFIEDIWKPAPTPPGGTSWDVLESTKEDFREGVASFVERRAPKFPRVGGD